MFGFFKTKVYCELNGEQLVLKFARVPAIGEYISDGTYEYYKVIAVIHRPYCGVTARLMVAKVTDAHMRNELRK